MSLIETILLRLVVPMWLLVVCFLLLFISALITNKSIALLLKLIAQAFMPLIGMVALILIILTIVL